MTIFEFFIVELIAVGFSIVIERLQCYALDLDHADKIQWISRVIRNLIIINLVFVLFHF